MDGAPPVGQQLGAEVEYRSADEGQGRDGLIFDAHTDVCLHYCTECEYSKNVKLYKVKADTHYRNTARTCTSSAYRPLSCI